MKRLIGLFLCFISIQRIEAIPLERSDPKNNSSDNKFRVIEIHDELDEFFKHTLIIRDAEGNTLFSETAEVPYWFLRHAQWSPKNDCVAITINISKTEVDTLVLRKDRQRFTRLKLPEIERDERCHIVSDGWNNNSDLKLRISYGNNRRSFPGDIISSYDAIIRFAKKSYNGTFLYKSKMTKETIPREE